MTISPLSNTNISATEKLNNKKLQSQNLPQISIIVPVFNSLEFLEDCLDSIYSSSPNIKIEVLVGIDSSSDDLKWFEQNHQKYNNLHVFWFNQNVGPYVIKNTLVDFAKSDNILFFDSDDIMNKNMISNYFNNIKNNLIVRFKYIEFTTKSELNNKSVSRSFADSVFGIRKSTFNKLNGFESWKSSADVEFHYRVKAHKISSKNLEFASFYKRIHKNSLSLKLKQDNKTVRQEYIGLLNKKLRLKNWNLHSKKTASCLKVEDYSSPLNLSTSLTNTHSAIVNKNFKLQHSKPASNINNSKVFNTKTDNNINKENNLSKLTVSSSDYISIIIPAFKASEFLDDCLTSITNQSFKNIEILIGIDACPETLDWALNNKHKYPNVSFFYFDTNEGPYIIKNTLANIASHDNILFFDADDLMEKDLLANVVQYMKNNTIVKIKFCDFAHSKGIKSASTFKGFGEGVFAIKKQDFIKLNGFEPWKCAADTEFQLRARYNRMSFANISKSFFFRRIHVNNLTVHPSTNRTSEIRRKYVHQINEKQRNKNWKLKDFKVKETKKLFTDVIITKNTIESDYISIIIPAWKVDTFIDDCISSIKKQVPSNIKIEILLGIDNCHKTLQHIKNNKEKYNDIEIYWFNENVGSYVIRNTLLSKAKYEKIIFFDADDVMHEDMLSTLNQHIQPNTIVRFKYYNFSNELCNQNLVPSDFYGHGVFASTKSTVLKLNGFEPWQCAADAEFHLRAEKNNLNFIKLEKRLFFRRQHPDSVTASPNTNANSHIRQSYRNIIQNKKTWQLDELKISNNYEKIVLDNNYIHLIISRVCVKWLYNGQFRHEKLGFSWQQFVKLSTDLYDKYLRNSLKNQVNQNFKLISLFDKDVKEFGNLLNNEDILLVNNMDSIVGSLKEYILTNYGNYNHILLTRLDRDDAIDLQFVNILQNTVNKYSLKTIPYYFDIKQHLMYDAKSKNFFSGDMYQDATSPFVSVLEDVNKLTIYPYSLSHGEIKDKMNGEKLFDLKGLQIIHGNNVLNKVKGKKTQLDISKFLKK